MYLLSSLIDIECLMILVLIVAPGNEKQNGYFDSEIEEYK